MLRSHRLVAMLTAGSDTAYARRITVILAAYCLLHLGLRFLLSPTLGWDDAQQALWASDLDWVYTYRQPSLYTWILWALFTVFGKSAIIMALLRYLIIFGTFFFLFRAARIVFEDRRRQVAVVSAYLLIYVFAFYAHHDLTHTTILAFSLSLTWFLFCRLTVRPDPMTYGLLGAVLVMGCLSKYNAVLFGAPLFLSALLLPRYRTIILNPRFGVTIVVALALATPYLVQLFSLPIPVDHLSDDVLGTDQGRQLAVIGEGLVSLLLALLEFPQPWLLACAFLLPELFRKPAEGGIRRLIALQILIAVACLVLPVLFMGASSFKGRWMHPILMTLPFWLFSGPILEDRFPRRLGRILFLTILFSLLAFGARIAVDQIEPRDSEKLRRTLPVAALRAPLEELGFADGLIVAETTHVGGNLALLLPDADVISLQNPPLVTSPDPERPRIYVWFDNFEHDFAAIEADIREKTAFDPADGERGSIPADIPGHDRTVSFGYMILR